MIRNVMFGWDGTLVATRDATLISVREAIHSALGYAYPIVDHEMTMLVDLGPTELIELWCPDPELAQQVALAFDDAYRRRSPLLVQAVEGAADVLTEVRALGLTASVMTAKSMSQIRHDLALTGFAHHFDRVIAGDDASTRPPRPDRMLTALEVLDVEAAAAAYVSGVRAEVVAAEAAGMTTLAVGDDAGAGKLTVQIAPSLQQVPEILGCLVHGAPTVPVLRGDEPL